MNFNECINEARYMASMSKTGLARYRVVRTYDGWEWFRLPDIQPTPIDVSDDDRQLIEWSFDNPDIFLGITKASDFPNHVKITYNGHLGPIELI